MTSVESRSVGKAKPDTPARQVSLRLVCDDSALTGALAQASEFARASEVFAEALERLLGAPDALQQVVCINADSGAASGAGEMVVRLEPSDRLRGLLATGGTGNV